MRQLLLLFLLPLSVNADVFRWTDELGKIHFSDQSHAGAKTLPIDSGYSYHTIKKIYDGDTLLLSNGSKVRFLGINTPEVESRYKTAQAGGEEAKHWLKKTLTHQKIRLEYDAEKQDKYHRLLAHIFTEDKQHINLMLVKKGLATVAIHPPNLKYTEDLLAAQHDAEKNKRGIWGRNEYQPKQATDLNKSNYKGWQRIEGVVKSIHKARKYNHLQLSDTFSIKISQQLISKDDFDQYLGQKIEARGWINKKKNTYSLFVRHMSQVIH